MKISFIEMSGFRGFKDKVRLDLPSGFAVLTGRNGAGKSTVFDAVDFALTGSINKFSVKAAKGGGLDEHIWWVGDGVPEDSYVTVGFIDAQGRALHITRSRERGLIAPIDQVAQLLCEGESHNESWPQTLVQTSLIRDETIASLSLDLPEQARFGSVRAAIGSLAGPDFTQRTNALVRAAGAAKDAQELRVTEIQAELGRALGALTEARSVAESQADIAEAERVVLTFAGDLDTTSAGPRAEALRRRVAERRQESAELERLIERAEALEAELLQSDLEKDAADAQALTTALTTARQNKALADEKLAHAEALMSAERENDSFASHVVALVEHGRALGLQDGHCPLCDAIRSSEQFEAALQAARARLEMRGNRAMRVAAQLQLAGVDAARAKVTVSTVEEQLANLDAKRSRIAQQVQELKVIFQRFGLVPTQGKAEELRRMLSRRREETARLEQALFTLEASNAHDRVMGLEERVGLLRGHADDAVAKLTNAERAAEAARQIDAAAKAVSNQVFAEHFDTVMPLLKELYRRVRPHQDWREIEIDFGGRVRASLNFSVGNGRNPQFLFSSGQRRAAGIAFLLAIHLSRPWCRLDTLLLDDPVQHTDDYRALNLVEILSAIRQTGRQIIVAVEDPGLADVLCRRLRSTVVESGRRFDLGIGSNGAARIETSSDVPPFPRAALKIAEAS
jgi:chromosome segregation protein